MTYNPRVTCPKCGRIVPQPDIDGAVVYCRHCRYQIDLTDQ